MLACFPAFLQYTMLMLAYLLFIGLLHLLDAIQDEAIRLGFAEDEVFGSADDTGEPCPYASEIHNDYTPCQCSEEQRQQCAQEI